MNGVPIIFLNEQSIIMLPINQSPIPIRNDLESNETKDFSSNTVESRLEVSYSLIKNLVENYVIVKMSYLTTINCVDT